MCPPAYFTVRDVKNPFMRADAAVDRGLAEQQWAALRDAFASVGIEPLTIDPVDDLEDMVFTANQVFVGSGAVHRRFVVPSQMRHASRRREVPHFVEWFRRRDYDVVDAALGDEYLEGHGDLLQHPERTIVWAGYGFRSSREGVRRFAKAMQPEGITIEPLELVDPVFYHLDTCFAPLSADAAIVYSGALAAESLERLRRGWNRLYEVTREDALRFVCNGVAVEGRFLVSHLPPALERILLAEDIAPLRVDVSEFEKSGGSVFCMKTLLPAD
jgi:N-dimethylarginine dimethylaminohydrolase